MPELTKKDERSIDAILGNDLPEAKSSVTYNVMSPNGFTLLFTVRNTDTGIMFEEMKDVEAFFNKNGYTPDARYGGGKKVESKTEDKCPKCGANLVRFTTKTGKSGVECSTRSYDFETQKTTGCDYKKWDSTETQTETPTSNGATLAQKKLLVDKGLWEDGMSKAEANQVIRKALSK